MIEDDRNEEIIRAAVSEYDRPPQTPRDEMWTAIQAARSAPAAGPRLHVSTADGQREHTHFVSRAWFGIAAAAMLLIATGVGIGRWTSQPVRGKSAAAEKPTIAVAETIVQPTTHVEPQKPRTHEEIRKSPRIIGNGELRLANGSGIGSYRAPSLGSTNVSYQVATQAHLEDAEALLTSFSLERRDARVDAHFAGWAKGLLSNTRLLLDSPAGDDPRRAKLLQDLELVLAQIVQLSPNAAAPDRELIQGSIQDEHVMTRLRSAIPAGQPRGILEK